MAELHVREVTLTHGRLKAVVGVNGVTMTMIADPKSERFAGVVQGLHDAIADQVRGSVRSMFIMEAEKPPTT